MTFDYVASAAAKSVAGMSILNHTSAQALIRSAFFMSAFYGGLCGSASARRSSEYGNFNPVQSATRLIEVKGGGSQTFSEDSYRV